MTVAPPRSRCPEESSNYLQTCVVAVVVYVVVTASPPALHVCDVGLPLTS
jgi:hypothetical protein